MEDFRPSPFVIRSELIKDVIDPIEVDKIRDLIYKNLASEENLLFKLIEKVLHQILKRSPSIEDIGKVILARDIKKESLFRNPEIESYGFAFDSVIYGTIKIINQNYVGDDIDVKSCYKYGFTLGYEFVPNSNYVKDGK